VKAGGETNAEEDMLKLIIGKERIYEEV